MSIKKIVVTIAILSIFAIALFIYPSMNQSVRAEQVNFAGYKNQSISFQEAKGLIKTYERIAASDAVIAQYFGKDIVDKILAQPGCVGVRMYYSKHANGKPGVIFVGVDKNGKDIISGVLAGPTIICPPYCGEQK
jgi:ABC-type dipeptide/oligopeptide/nickel transport system permease subunit